MDSAKGPNSCSLFTPATILPALRAISTTSAAAVQSGSTAYLDLMVLSSVCWSDSSSPRLGTTLNLSPAQSTSRFQPQCQRFPDTHAEYVAGVGTSRRPRLTATTAATIHTFRAL
jgi:hypothetical protein